MATISDNQKVLMSECMRKIAENGMQIIQVKARPISDEAEGAKDNKFLKDKDWKFWATKEIDVFKTDFLTNPGYVKVNDEFNIPLQSFEPTEGEVMYFYDKDAAITKVTLLNRNAEEAIEELTNSVLAMREFIKTINSKNLY